MNNLINILNYAYKNVNFYNTLYNQYIHKEYIESTDIAILPIIKKDAVINNYDTIISHEQKNNMIIVSTSGTTGLPLKVKWTKSDFTQSNFYTWLLRKKWYDISPNDKFITFHSSASTGEQCVLLDVILYNNERTLSLGRYKYDEAILDRYISLILEFQPKWILGQPSIILILARHIKKKKVVMDSLRYIELNGEFVENRVYQELKGIFNIPIANLYGSVEFNGIALTCPYGNMHILENNVYVEDELYSGQLIVTGLVNKAMPLLRYAIGDIGHIDRKTKCKCGCNGGILKLQRGRESEVITINDTLKLDPAFFLNIIDEINISEHYIMQFYVEVNGKSIRMVILTCGNYVNYLEMRKNYFKNKFFQLGIPDYNFDIEITTQEKDFMDSNRKFSYIRFMG